MDNILYLWNWIGGSNYPPTRETRTPFQFLFVLGYFINWIMESNLKLYWRVHSWLYRHYGKANHCDFCKQPLRKYEWALKKDHTCDFNRDNYYQLCKFCHRKYDVTDEFRRRNSERMKKDVSYNFTHSSQGRTRGASYSAIKIYSIDLDGIMEFFDSIAEVKDKYPYIKHTNAISRCLDMPHRTTYKRHWYRNNNQNKKLGIK